MFRLQFVWIQVCELVNFFRCFLIHPVGRWCWLDAVDENFAFVEADFYAVTTSSVLQTFSELLELLFTVSQQIDVVGKRQVAERSSFDRH